MAWFDAPAVDLRKRVPFAALTGFNEVEVYALQHLSNELPQNKPYQLGIVLALWMKAGELTGKIKLSGRDSRKVQAIYESCVKILRDKSYTAFWILVALCDEQQMFGMPPDLYIQCSVNVLG
jgi:hypothetical protein